jgi:hypothetical protein
MATEIYRRERGALPPSEEALVGAHLGVTPLIYQYRET